jgi:hypothetical protein
MYVIKAQLRSARSGRSPIQSAELVDMIHRSVRPEDGVEHIYAQTHSRGAELVFFLAQSTLDAAEQAATMLCCEFLSTSPALRGWMFVGCTAALPSLAASTAAPVALRSHTW